MERELHIELPGDKSISHRAMLVSAMAAGPSRIRRLSTGADVRSTRSALEALGIRTEEADEECVVRGAGLHGLKQAGRPIDCGNSGTTMRLLSGVLSGQPFRTELTGDASLRRRPMRRVMEPLSRMGAVFGGDDDGRAPFWVEGSSHLHALRYTLPVASAQVKSAILFAGLFADGPTTVYEPERTRDHTERFLHAVVDERNGQRSATVTPREMIEPFDISVPGDPSSAIFPAAAALLTANIRLVVKHVSLNPTRTAWVEILRSHGANITTAHEGVTHEEPHGDLHIQSSDLKGEFVLEERIPECIDEIPALAVIAAVAGLSCVVRHAQELRRKESDRISTLVRNLRAIGCDVEEFSDGFASRAKNGLIGASIETLGDHRIAMAFGVAGLVVPGMSFDDPSCVNVSFPGFWDILQRFRT